MKWTICLLAMLCPLLSMCQPRLLTGHVLNPEQEPIAGATVRLLHSTIASITNSKGEFSIPYRALSNTDHRTTEQDSLQITAIGYEAVTVAITQLQSSDAGLHRILMPRKITALDEALVIAYGRTSKRFATGNISKLSATEIAQQPVANPLAALSGRIPGLLVTQGSGVPGSTINVQIRGRTSLDPALSKNDPLFIIDGVPFESGNTPVNQLSAAANNPVASNVSVASGLSPFNTINPQDIESIEVLKDADATAIYGSRGANGVILISTKKGKAGKTVFTVNSQAGWSRITRQANLLSSSQYLTMRREAFANDGSVPTAGTAPDLVLWDTTRYTDFAQLFTGGTARASTLNVSVTGGNAFTQFSLGGGYHRETTVFPGSFADSRGSLRAHVFHSPASKKWDIGLTAIYAVENNRLFRTDITRHIILPPHLQLVAADGSFNWQEDGVNFSSLGFTNPLAELQRSYRATNQQLSANLLFNYRMSKTLVLRMSAGYSTFSTREQSSTPRSAIAPDNATLASSLFANSDRLNWIMEPQAEYTTRIGRGKLQALAGTSFQQRSANNFTASGSGYTNDLLLNSLAAAAQVTATTGAELYKYQAVFGRLLYNWQQKYLVNVSARRDGSSRFGPGKQFANFGAVGVGWIFTAEPWMQRQQLLSFGKLRSSYGVTGNDQIGDYKYLDLWTNTSNAYQGVPGFRPTALFNPDYNWEKNRKWEVAAELGFLNDQITMSVAYYQHRSSNQLVSYRLPNQTGFSSVVKNLPALVENSGWEVVAQVTAVKQKKFSWTTSLNLTIPSNRLLSFPDLAASSYRSSYVEGKSLSVLTGLKYQGVDAGSGLYVYEDLNGDGQYSSADMQVLGDLDPVCYGGINNALQYKQWQLDIFCEYRNQQGRNYLAALYSNTPGLYFNQPQLVMDRWQKAGDVAPVQQFTATGASAAFAAASYLSASDAIYSDASFIRIKTLGLSYQLPELLCRKMKISQWRFYGQAQNLFTLTAYRGADPESQNYLQLPPLKTIVLGCQLTF